MRPEPPQGRFRSDLMSDFQIRFESEFVRGMETVSDPDFECELRSKYAIAFESDLRSVLGPNSGSKSECDFEPILDSRVGSF